MPELSTREASPAPAVQVCIKCGIEKPINQFHKDRQNIGGRSRRCKACAAQHYAENRESAALYRKIYYAENRESEALYYQAHKDKKQAYSKLYHIEHKQDIARRMVKHSHTVAGYVVRLWDSLNRRTVNGSHPRYDAPQCCRYLDRGIRLEMTREDLTAKVEENLAAIQAVWASGESVHCHRIGPSIHYSADNIVFVSESKHHKLHARQRTHNEDE